MNLLALALEGKRLGLLRELVPGASIAVLLNPDATLFAAQSKDIDNLARAAGQKVQVLKARNERALGRSLSMQRPNSALAQPLPVPTRI